eukprot:Nk52_evm1s1024 gene=Nk52_evmTU1s1024
MGRLLIPFLLLVLVSSTLVQSLPNHSQGQQQYDTNMNRQRRLTHAGPKQNPVVESLSYIVPTLTQLWAVHSVENSIHATPLLNFVLNDMATLGSLEKYSTDYNKTLDLVTDTGFRLLAEFISQVNENANSTSGKKTQDGSPTHQSSSSLNDLKDHKHSAKDDMKALVESAKKFPKNRQRRERDNANPSDTDLGPDNILNRAINHYHIDHKLSFSFAAASPGENAPQEENPFYSVEVPMSVVEQHQNHLELVGACLTQLNDVQEQVLTQKNLNGEVHPTCKQTGLNELKHKGKSCFDPNQEPEDVVSCLKNQMKEFAKILSGLAPFYEKQNCKHYSIFTRWACSTLYDGFETVINLVAANIVETVQNSEVLKHLIGLVFVVEKILQELKDNSASFTIFSFIEEALALAKVKTSPLKKFSKQVLKGIIDETASYPVALKKTIGQYRLFHSIIPLIANVLDIVLPTKKLTWRKTGKRSRPRPGEL